MPKLEYKEDSLGRWEPDPCLLAAEKVSSLGKDWHKFCLKCERCSKTLTPGGHAEVSRGGGLLVGGRSKRELGLQPDS